MSIAADSLQPMAEITLAPGVSGCVSKEASCLRVRDQRRMSIERRPQGNSRIMPRSESGRFLQRAGIVAVDVEHFVHEARVFDSQAKRLGRVARVGDGPEIV